MARSRRICGRVCWLGNDVGCEWGPWEAGMAGSGESLSDVSFVSCSYLLWENTRFVAGRSMNAPSFWAAGPLNPRARQPQMWCASPLSLSIFP